MASENRDCCLIGDGPLSELSMNTSSTVSVSLDAEKECKCESAISISALLTGVDSSARAVAAEYDVAVAVEAVEPMEVTLSLLLNFCADDEFDVEVDCDPLAEILKLKGAEELELELIFLGDLPLSSPFSLSLSLSFSWDTKQSIDPLSQYSV